MITLEYTEHTLTVEHEDFTFKVIAIATPVRTFIDSIRVIEADKQRWRELKTVIKVQIRDKAEQMAKNYISQLHAH